MSTSAISLSGTFCKVGVTCFSSARKGFLVMSYPNLTPHVYYTTAGTRGKARDFIAPKSQDLVPAGQLSLQNI